MKKGIKTIEKIGKIFFVFMFSFSQLSFPIEVLADELSKDYQAPVETEEEINEESNEESASIEENNITPQESVKNEEPVEEPIIADTKTIVKINDEETNEYTLSSTSENKKLKISYGDEFGLKEEILDFSKKLYGDYTYTYNIDEDKSVDIKIHYEGNNNEILKKYLNSNLVLDNNSIQINGTKEGITRAEFLQNIDFESLKNDYEVELNIDLINDTDLIKNNTVLTLSSTDTTNPIEIQYLIKINRDYNDDGFVSEKDAFYIMDKILENNNDGENTFNILDATNPVFKTNSWNNEVEAKDQLQNSFVNKTEVPVDGELVVKYYITGFQEDKLTGIEGKINYNKEILSLMNVNVSTATYGAVQENGHFAYLLDNYSSEGIFMTLTFKALKSGEANISIDNILASLGIKANLDDSVSTTITVFENGKGGDVDLENTVKTVEQPKTEQPTIVPTPVALTNTENIIARTISLSSDNLIKSLTIKGYNIKFDPNTLEYSLKVKNSVKSLNLEVVLNDESASYEISGNQNFKVGENTVTIKVTAEDGTERTYTLKVTREKAKSEEEQEEKKSSKTIIIILIILVIIGLIYVIFKDDEEDSKESKK